LEEGLVEVILPLEGELACVLLPLEGELACLLLSTFLTHGSSFVATFSFVQPSLLQVSLLSQEPKLLLFTL